MPRISRRTFLRAAGVGGASLAVLGAAPKRVQAARAAEANEERIPTICEMCGSRCGLIAIRRDGKVVRIEGNPDSPIGMGRPCARGNAAPSALYDPDRLKEPLKRQSDGSYQPISWEQAFKEIGDKLNEIRNAAGPEAVVWGEYAHLNTPLTKRLMEAYGSPNHTVHAATCYANRNVGYGVVFGTLPSVDYANVKYLVSPGRNSLGGIKAGEVVKLSAAKAGGAKIVCLDPRLSELAGWAHEWLPIKPATDGAFLLAVAHVLINEHLYDKEFVDQKTTGFAELAKAVREYTPEWAEQLTGIDADTTRRIARELAAHRPAAVIDPGWHGGNGMYNNGFEAARAGAVVNALLGNFGKKGGLKAAMSVALGPIDEPPEGQEAAGAAGGG